MMFMDGDDGGGGGEGESQGMSVFEDNEPSTPTEPQQPQQPEPQQQQPSPSFVDARQLASEFGHVIGQHFQPPQKEMSIEEAKQLLNVWEPTKEWLAKYEDPETRNQALAEQRDGLIRQADTIMRYRMSELQQAMDQRYAPVVEYMQQQEAQAGEYRFAQYFPQLNHQGLRPLLFSVAQSLLASGTRFRSEPELFTAIAKGVESVIKVSNPQFSLQSNGGAGAAPQQQGKRIGHTAGRLPVTTPGAGGGGMKGPGPPKPRGLAIFDP
jgi:DNA-binding transcriptional MerR regulator